MPQPQISDCILHFMLRRSSLVECVTRNRCLQSVNFFFIRHYVQPFLSKNPKYTFYTIKSSHINCNTEICIDPPDKTCLQIRSVTHSTNEDLLNIKCKGDPEVSYPLSYVRNPCVIKVILLACFTYTDIF
jgi:hypothetical protein